MMIGGMEEYFASVLEEMTARGHQTMALVPEGEFFDELSKRMANNGIDVHRLDTDPWYGRKHQIERCWAAIKLFRRWKPDVIHLHTGGATGGMAVLLLARLFTKARVLYTEHNVPIETPSRYHRWMHYLMDRVTHVNIACSHKSAAVRRERFGFSPPPSRSAVVHIGIRLPAPREFPPDARETIWRDLGIPKDAQVAGCVVRLVHEKGLHDLLKAVSIIRESRNLHLILIGYGPLREELERYAAELGIDGAVHFLGRQSDPHQYFPAMDVFTLAVPVGTGSLALMEAMALGLPAVITFAGPEEAVIDGKTGLAAPPNDAVGLAASLERILADDELRARLATAGQVYVRREFGIERVVDDLTELYESIDRKRIPERFRIVEPAGS
jgi:glycosyltransferase involved in cell wall biosynthesis